MSKEVVYIDINDDITSVIGKIKNSKERIVALVPPKQIGLLQSAVNLQLLARAAKEAKKYIVIITTKDSLSKLAAMAKIPVAKTLQSKPVLAKLPIEKPEDDLIDGETMPVGELVAASSSLQGNTKVSTSDVITDPTDPTPKPTPPVKQGFLTKLKAGRKKIILTIVFLLFLTAGLIWALVFAPQASIVLKTKTKLVNINQTVNLTEDSSKVNHESNIIHAQSQILEKSRKLEFAATGDKNIGEKAQGDMTITNTALVAVTIPAGTSFSKDGCTFVTTGAVSLARPGGTIFDPKPDRKTVKVVATAPGEACNVKEGDYKSAISYVTGFGSEMTGGTDKVVKVITENDINAAKEKITELGREEAISELKNKFDASAVVINESLKIEVGEAKSSVEVDKEAPENKATLEQTVKYSMTAIVRGRLVEYIDQLVLKQEEGAKVKQKVYQSGDDQLQFDDYTSKDGNVSVKIITQVRIGPSISIDEVKEFAKGKNYGDIQSRYETIEGIETVSVDFRPMWVRRVPNNTDRINVSIDLQ